MNVQSKLLDIAAPPAIHPFCLDPIRPKLNRHATLPPKTAPRNFKKANAFDNPSVSQRRRREMRWGWKRYTRRRNQMMSLMPPPAIIESTPMDDTVAADRNQEYLTGRLRTRCSEAGKQWLEMRRGVAQRLNSHNNSRSIVQQRLRFCHCCSSSVASSAQSPLR